MGLQGVAYLLESIIAEPFCILATSRKTDPIHTLLVLSIKNRLLLWRKQVVKKKLWLRTLAISTWRHLSWRIFSA
ncbi:hypothetical protein LAD77_01130 [Klebsiella pneumoniae]|nr:hypothetical protein [Klebsiella pneumoniae]